MASYRYHSYGHRRDWPEYGMSTQEGDVYVHRMVRIVAGQIRLGRIDRDELPTYVLQGLDYVRTAPVPTAEVDSLEVKLNIAYHISLACKDAQIATISPVDWEES
jgi:hypothetical protein